MKVLKHINFWFFVLLTIPLTQNNIMASVSEKRQEIKIKERRKLNNLKKEKKNLTLDLSKIVVSNNKDWSKEAFKNALFIKSLAKKTPVNFEVKEKTFIQTLLSTISRILWVLIFLSFIFSAIFDKAPTREKFPIFSFLIKIVGFGKPTTQVKRPPGSYLIKIADLLPKKYGESLKQEISDMYSEYYEALSKKNIWRARFIVAFYYIGLCFSTIMWISDKSKKVAGIVPKKD
jgi:hypothetical protein